MTEGEGIDDPPRRVARWGYVVATIVLALALVLLGLWLARKPIADHFIGDALRARGVAATYRIERIGFRTQRLSDVRIGDPAHPDLVADWVEVDTSLWTSGATVSAVRAGLVRMRASLADGKLSFGAIDRVLPVSSSKAFALPAMDTQIADARIALATSAGSVLLGLKGSGKLDDGFAGTLSARAPLLDVGGCRIDRVAAVLQVRVVQARPDLVGPIRLARASCRGASISQARADLTVAVGAQLDHWKGSARLGIAALAMPGAGVRAISGPIAFTGSAKDVSGTVDLHSGAFVLSDVSGAGSAMNGRYRYAGGLAFQGRASVTKVAVPHTISTRLASWRGAGAGTPVGPIAAHLISAVEAAGRSSDVQADVSAIVDGARGQVSITRLAFASASGARATMTSAGGATYRWPDGALHIAGDVTVAGGGLPGIRAQLRQTVAGAPMTGRLTMAPYSSGSATLALAPVDFALGAKGGLRVASRFTLSGPVAGGRIDALSLPLAATWDGGERLMVNPACAPLAFERLRMAGLDLPRSAVTLCPRDGALLRIDKGKLRGGGGIGPVRLGGTRGVSPLAVSVRGAECRLRGGTFAVSGLGVRLGTAERSTRLDLPTLDGTFGAGGAQGTFAGAGGQIGNVPLMLSAAEGRWRVANGALALDGALSVSDTATTPRFKPLAARSVALTLADNRIAATGTLFEPTRSIKVADVAIVHDLGTGAGTADLTVPGIAFGERFQPDLLTPLTYGVIANVTGTLAGAGHIRWTTQGVSSDGVFRTPGIDLAAAFGPATGIAGEVRFTDLLALETAPGQIATVKTINPGVPVKDGTIRYRLLSGARIAVEQGRWPFAGGTLTLEPTLLDFGAAGERRMTFRVEGMAAGQFLQQFDFKNLNATGVFDGTLPMIFDASGGRIEDGHLVVREGGGTIAYVGELSQKDIGLWGNFAFQALKSLRYRNLDIVMNGPLAGEMVTEVRFAGVGQGVGAKRNFILNRLQKLPLVFNVRIKAPFRQLIDTAQSFYDPKRLVERNLPALLEEQNKRAAPPTPVQPPESRIVP